MELKDRIAAIIKVNQLNASSFAEALGVQRSSLSHIMNGRNKPSLDFIEKVLEHFPRVDAQWLITGKQSEAKIEQEKTQVPKQNLGQDRNNKDQVRSKLPHSENKEIDRIVMFFIDGTFEVYEHK